MTDYKNLGQKIDRVYSFSIPIVERQTLQNNIIVNDRKRTRNLLARIRIIEDLQQLSPYPDKSGTTPLEIIKGYLSSKSLNKLNDEIEGAKYNLEYEVLDIQQRAKPIMSVYDLIVMLPKPIFFHIHREELLHGIFNAIEDWDMPVRPPKIIKKNDWLLRNSIKDAVNNNVGIPTLKTRIHFDIFEKFAKDGKINAEAVGYAELWKKCITAHEGLIKLSTYEKQEKINRCLESAKYFAQNIDKYLKPHEKKSLLAVFRRVTKKENVSRSWLYENITKIEKDRISNILINN